MFRNLPIQAFQQIDVLTKPYIGKLPKVDKGMPISGNAEAQAARENARKLLQCESGKGLPIEALFRLRKIAEAAVSANKFDKDQLQILSELWVALRGAKRIIELSETIRWSGALEQIIFSMRGSSFRNPAAPSDRERLLGEALLTLSHKGFPFRIDGRGASLTELSFEALCNRIEKKIKRVGGEYVANAMLNVMQKVGRIEDGTLLHARTPLSLRNKTRSGTPWHYIYSLALKHIAVVPQARNPELVLHAIEKLAVAMAATLDVEPHSSYENLSLSPASLVGFLFETVIYDELFGIPQWQPRAGEHLVPLWIDALVAEGCQFPIADPTDWKSLGERILKIASVSRLSRLDVSTLTSSQSFRAFSKELLTAITAPNGCVNKSYKTPSDAQKRTASNFPILSAGHGRLVVQPKSVAGRAFAESLYTAMRNANVPDLENVMGRALERVTEKVFEIAGMPVSVSGQKYRNAIRNEDLEADLVFETDERIFLVECTKKPLTNRARGGHTLDSLRDFNGSFLKLLQQLAQHEARLRKVGHIKFKNGKIVYLEGRSVEKVALSLFDHGSLQNRDMTIGFVEALADVHMHSDRLEAQDTVSNVNKRLKFINQALAEIVSFDPIERDRGLFRFAMSTWWLSIDQLHYLALKEGDLWKTMQRVRHITARSGDLVYEVKCTLNMNEVGKAMFDACKKMDNRGIL